MEIDGGKYAYLKREAKANVSAT